MVEIEHHDGDRSLRRVLGVEEFLRLGPERVATQRSGEGVAFGDALEFSLSAPLCASGDGYGDGESAIKMTEIRVVTPH
ncbi:hypothetical protein ACETU7_23360 [Rhodococcus sp. 3Y1]